MVMKETKQNLEGIVAKTFYGWEYTSDGMYVKNAYGNMVESDGRFSYTKRLATIFDVKKYMQEKSILMYINPNDVVFKHKDGADLVFARVGLVPGRETVAVCYCALKALEMLKNK